MKRCLVGFCASLMVLAMLSYGVTESSGASAKDETAAKKEGPYKIGLSMLTLNATYYKAMAETFKAEVEKRGAKAFVINAQADPNKQVSDIEDLLQKDIDFLILNPKDPIACIKKVKEALSMGIPTIVLDSGIDASAPVLCEVRSNNQANGEKVGEALVKRLGNIPYRVAIISGNKGNVVGKIRRISILTGIIETSLQTHGNVDLEVVAQGWTDWTAPSSLNAIEDILVAHKGNFNVLVTEYDQAALSSIKPLKNAGIADDVILVAAADGQKEALKLMLSGDYPNYLATGMNIPSKVTQKAVDIAFRYLDGERVFPRNVYTDAVAITAENADQYYDPDAVF